MARGNPNAEALVKLRHSDPVAWSRTVTAAVRLAGGSLAHAALTLGVGHRTLYGWLDRPCHACAVSGYRGGVVCAECHGAGRLIALAPAPHPAAS